MNVVKKSANQMWKDSGTTLSFKDWMNREKGKKFMNATGDSFVPTNTILNDSVQNAINAVHKEGGLQTTLTGKYIFGVNKKVWIGIGVGLVVITGIIIFKHTHKS